MSAPNDRRAWKGASDGNGSRHERGRGDGESRYNRERKPWRGGGRHAYSVIKHNDRMHEANRYKDRRPDFAHLARKYPDTFGKFVKLSGEKRRGRDEESDGRRSGDKRRRKEDAAGRESEEEVAFIDWKDPAALRSLTQVGFTILNDFEKC
jgi:hypothetical protein